MTCTYLAGWVGLLSIASPEVSVEADPGDSAAPPVLVTGSLHLGAGSLDGEAALLARPRFAWQTDRLSVALSAPVWLEPPATRDEALGWYADWRSARTYAGLVERLELRLFDERLVLRAGALAQETLGRGAIVDRFHNQRDPWTPRAGLRVDLATDRVETSALVDDLTRPNVVAARVALAPAALFGGDPETRLWSGLELAADLRAPRANGGAPFAVAGLDTGYALVRGGRGELEAFTALAVTSDAATGAHLGLALALRGRGAAFRLRAEAIAGSVGYAPGYFDEVYVWERGGLGDAALAKAQRRPRAALGLRTSADLVLGAARVGLAVAIPDPRAPAALTGYLRVDGERLAAAFYLTERRVSGWGDLVALRDGTVASAELAYAFYRGVMVFTQARHGPRPTGARAAALDWVFGLGYGAKNGQTAS